MRARRNLLLDIRHHPVQHIRHHSLDIVLRGRPIGRVEPRDGHIAVVVAAVEQTSIVRTAAHYRNRVRHAVFRRLAIEVAGFTIKMRRVLAELIEHDPAAALAGSKLTLNCLAV